MLDILERFNEQERELKARRAAIDTKIEEAQNRIQRLEKRREKLHSPGWVKGIVEPIAAALAVRTGLSWEIYGPFGLSCETSIYLREDMSKSICDQPTRSITLEPHHDGEDFVVRYRTGERSGEYAPGTLGHINGLDYLTSPLPDTIEEIEKLLVESGATKRE